MAQTVSAAFLDPEAAERAIGALEDHGIPRDHISVATGETGAARENTGAPTFAERAATRPDADGFVEVRTADSPTPMDMNAATDARMGGRNTAEPIVEAEGKHGITTTTPADAAKGAVEGSIVGLGLGLLVGVAALTVPGVGPVLAAGPLWSALGGALGTTAAGAVAGGVTGYLRDMGVPDLTAERYSQALGRGSIVVSVHTEDTATEPDVETLFVKYKGRVIATH